MGFGPGAPSFSCIGSNVLPAPNIAIFFVPDVSQSLFHQQFIENIKSILVLKIFLTPESVLRVIEVILEESHELEILADCELFLKIYVAFQKFFNGQVAVTVPVHALARHIEFVFGNS
jgi:hypothetical protein